MKKAARPASNDGPSGLYGMPGHLIRRCHQISMALFHEECGQSGVTPQQYAALRTLAAHDGVDQITLAGLVAFDRTTVGDVVARLAANGLLRREEGSEDRRTKSLFVTDAGRRLLKSLDAAVDRVQRRLVAPLDAAEQARFVEYLARIALVNNEYSRAPLRAPRRHKD
jgi:DNA-binding MarR family transcriptional regulator